VLISDQKKFPNVCHKFLVRDDSGNLSLEGHIIRELPRGAKVVALGIHDHVAQYLAKHDPLDVSNAVGIVNDLVQIEIDAHPENVGPPISILVLEKSGAHWEQQGACADIASFNDQQ